jgi:hypothetical protein
MSLVEWWGTLSPVEQLKVLRELGIIPSPPKASERLEELIRPLSPGNARMPDLLPA